LTTLINGEASTKISASDRGFLYGQTVFETLTVVNQRPQLLDLHLARLQHGCRVLGIPFEQYQRDAITAEIHELSHDHASGVLRLTMSMGGGERGYRNPQNRRSNRIISFFDYPKLSKDLWLKGIDLGLVEIRLSDQPALAGIKHGNRLEQIIAREQWQGNWQEALLLDQRDKVIEGTQTNVFVVKDGRLSTPSLERCGVAGVMRDYLLNHAEKLGVQSEIMSLSVSDVRAADEVFLSNSVIGIWPVKHFQTSIYSKFEISSKFLKFIIKNEIIPHY